MIRFTILGCGSSGGVPRLGGDWGDCDPQNPKNNRQRCAALVEKISPTGITKILIDAGPDFRNQMLQSQTDMVDALVLTHEHADHIHGIDDMRQFVNLKTAAEIDIRMQDPSFEMSREKYHEMVEASRLPAFAGLTCFDALMARFGYLFEKEEGSLYPPIMQLHRIDGPFEITGDGGSITFEPFAVPHGSIEAYGFRIDDLVYLPDVFELTDEARALMQDLEILILDCLQFRPHGTHANYEKAMLWIEDLRPKRAILTNLHTPMDYEKLNALTPANVEPAFDGLVVELK